MLHILEAVGAVRATVYVKTRMNHSSPQPLFLTQKWKQNSPELNPQLPNQHNLHQHNTCLASHIDQPHLYHLHLQQVSSQ